MVQGENSVLHLFLTLHAREKIMSAKTEKYEKLKFGETAKSDPVLSEWSRKIGALVWTVVFSLAELPCSGNLKLNRFILSFLFVLQHPLKLTSIRLSSDLGFLIPKNQVILINFKLGIWSKLIKPQTPKLKRYRSQLKREQQFQVQ